jgi:hypothetical protein
VNDAAPNPPLYNGRVDSVTAAWIEIVACAEADAVGRRVRLVDGAIYGRFTHAEIRLRDPSVARRHGVFEVRDGRWWVRDGETTNGTVIDGQRLQEAMLSDGDVLHIGYAVLRFSQPDAPPS